VHRRLAGMFLSIVLITAPVCAQTQTPATPPLPDAPTAKTQATAPGVVSFNKMAMPRLASRLRYPGCGFALHAR
jgi:hypothetical protein